MHLYILIYLKIKNKKMFKNSFHKIAILTILFNSITSDLIIRSPKELQSQFISKTN